MTPILAEDTTEKKVWERLIEMYQWENLKSVLNIQENLHLLSYREKENIERHFQSF